MIDSDALRLPAQAVAALRRSERAARLRSLIEEAHGLVDQAVAEHVRPTHEVAATVVLFSGGKDSTVLAHLFRDRASHAAHANTTIGVEATREFVRATCVEWGLPLLERYPPPGGTYRDLVLAQGFPGPGHHYKMYQRLKERALRQVRRELVRNPRRERVLFLAGRRRDESQRRAALVPVERVDSVVWISPLINWTSVDLNEYRLLYRPPRNPVTDELHMSGECLCGSFAAPGERDALAAFRPEVLAMIRELEAELVPRDDIPAYRKTWGWGADPTVLAASRVQRSRTGPLCTSCDAKTLHVASLDLSAATVALNMDA